MMMMMIRAVPSASAKVLHRHQHACESARTNNLACSKLCVSPNHSCLFVLLISNDESEKMGFGLELDTETRNHGAFSLACSVLNPVFAGSNSSQGMEVCSLSSVLCCPT